jgi:hypothetical protein
VRGWCDHAEQSEKEMADKEAERLLDEVLTPAIDLLREQGLDYQRLAVLAGVSPEELRQAFIRRNAQRGRLT